MVIVPKKLGAVRICVDLKLINESVLWAVHPIPKVEEILALLSGAFAFMKLMLTAVSGRSLLRQTPNHWLPSSHLVGDTVLISCLTRLRQWELFQKRMNKILEGLEGTVCYINDVLVFGAQYVVKKLFTGPCDSQGLFLNLSIVGFCFQHGVRCISHRSPAFCNNTAPNPKEEASAETLLCEEGL